MSLPVVAVVGRPNVGKSTFFNRVLGKRLAIVDDRPGVTRDRNFAKAEWAGRHFFLVDTGGIIEKSDQALDRQVREQAMVAIDEADLLLLVVDGKEGLHPIDEKVADILRKQERPVILVVNKEDSLPKLIGLHEFWGLGLGDPAPVSAVSGKGSGDLLDRIVAALPPEEEEEDDPKRLRVAVIGKPNVGKSSIVNRLFGEERSVVSDISGTTRDPVDSQLTYHDHTLVFVDTAGLRRQSKVKDSVEYYSALRTDRVVHDADICLVVVDASEGELHHQDVRIIEEAWQAGAGVGVLVNKWDLVEKETQTAQEFLNAAVARYPFLRWVPFLFVSAVTGQRLRKGLDMILDIAETRRRRVQTSEVNEVLQALIHRQPPPVVSGREIKFKYGTQVADSPPTFVLWVNFPQGVPDHYVRYLLNGFRDAWGFTGTHLRLRLRDSSKS
ncbi:MAG TPA: ribosome biogenesis GTPase Der [Longimicrobiales bacterium]|nr:ribosome biogenesis GTPase Der [Longimicrobiales bacterium]